MTHFVVVLRALLAFVVFASAGCATNKINWAQRVGSYTHDQAILEFGPPDKQAALTDGTVVAEWMTRRGRTAIYATGPGYYSYRGGVYYPSYVQPGAPDYFLRLTFGPDGKLSAWKKFVR